MYLLYARVELKALHRGLGLYKTFGLNIWEPYWFIDTNIQNCKFQQPAYYHFSVVTFSNSVTHILALVGISQMEWS